MKKLIACSLALLLALSLAACNKTEPPAVSDEPAPWNGLKNTATGAVISLGMTQEEVEALLGEGTAFDSQERAIENMEQQQPERFAEGEVIYSKSIENLAEYSYGEGADYIEVSYVDALVAGVSVSAYWMETETSNWCDQSGFTLGTLKPLVIEQYGDNEVVLASAPAEDGTVVSVREYYYDQDGNRLEEYAGSSYMALFAFSGQNDDADSATAISIFDVSAESGELPTDEAPWNGLKNTATGAVITLGMTQEEVEALLGEGTEFNRNVEIAREQGLSDAEIEAQFGSLEMEENSYYYGEGANSLWVNYWEGAVIGILTHDWAFGADPAPSNWADQYGISYGSPGTAVIERYGEIDPLLSTPDENGKTFAIYDYGFDADGNIMGRSAINTAEPPVPPYAVIISVASGDDGGEVVNAIDVYDLRDVSETEGEAP